MLSDDTLDIPAVAKMMNMATKVLGYDLGQIIREGEQETTKP